MANATEERVGLVTLRNVRLSYPNIFKPGKGLPGNDGKIQPGKYGATLIIDPETKIGKANLAKLKAAKEAVMAEQWGAKPPKLSAARLCTKKYKPPEDEEGNPDLEDAKEEYLDMYIVSARNPDKPQVVDNVKVGDKWRRLKEGDGKPYGGCRVNVIIRLWAQDNDFGQRVNASLELVQFYKHDTAFGSGPIDTESMLDDDMVAGGDFDELDDYGEDGDDDDPAGSAGADGGGDDDDDDDDGLV